MAKKAKFRKGSAAAKAHMAKLRAMVGKRRKTAKKSRRKAKRIVPSLKSLTRSINTLRRKGRKIVKRQHIENKPFYFTGRKPQITISEGDFMPRKKSRRRSSKRYSGFDGGKKRRSRRSRRGLFMGGIGGGRGMKGITDLLMQGAAGAAGAVGSAYVANVVPLPENLKKFKPAVPLLVSVLLMTFGKKIPMSKPLAFGAAMSGVLGFAHQFIPNLPALAGVDSAPELTQDEQALLGAPQYMGAVAEYAGETSLTPASM